MKSKKYFRSHAWIIYHYGKATNCENKSCEYLNPKRYEWALIKGMLPEKKRENYMQLCPSCHRKYDYTDEQRNKISEAKKGKTAKNKIKVILNNEKVFNSITEASLSTGVGITSIVNNLKGLSKKTKAGVWVYK